MEPKQIVIDTDVLIELLDTNKPKHLDVLLSLQKLERANAKLLLSVITQMELIQGSKNKSEVDRLLYQIESFERIELSSAVGEMAFNLILKYSKSHSLKIPDAIIAADCLLLGIPLFTFNLKHYKFIDGLNLYKLNKSIP